MAIPNPVPPSVSFLRRSRENNGESNTPFQEEAAVNLRVTVSIRVVSKVGFFIWIVQELRVFILGPHGHRGYRRDQSW